MEKGDPELLVAGDGPEGAPHGAGIELWSLGAPEFSVDGTRVFFSVANGELGALCDVDVATRKARWILTAIQTEVIRKGPFQGPLLRPPAQALPPRRPPPRTAATCSTR